MSTVPTTQEEVKAELEALRKSSTARDKEMQLLTDHYINDHEAGAKAMQEAQARIRELEERASKAIEQMNSRKAENSAAHWRLIKYNSKVAALEKVREAKEAEIKEIEEDSKGHEAKFSKWRLPRYAKEAGAWKKPKHADMQDLLKKLRHSQEQDLDHLPGMINTEVRAVKLKPSMRSFLSYDAYVVVELTTATEVAAQFGTGFWKKEAFEERRGKTQGGKKTSVVKDNNNPVFDEALIVPCPPVENTVIVFKVFDYFRIGQHVLIAMGVYPCKNLHHGKPIDIELDLRTYTDTKFGSLTAQLTFLASAVINEPDDVIEDMPAEFDGTDEEWAKLEKRRQSQIAEKAKQTHAEIGLVRTNSLGEITTAEFGNKERYEEAKKSSWSSWFS